MTNKIKIETIFDLIKHKDKRGFELLHEEYYRMMFGVAFTVLNNEEMSKDTVQNVFIKLFNLNYDKFPSANELTWLYTVIRNESLQLLRKEKKHSNYEEIPELPAINDEINDYVDMEAYYSMIASLNDTQKQVVTLKVIGGLSHKEISKITQKPVGTIQWIYNTSIKRLRIALVSLSAFALLIGAALLYQVLGLLNPSDGLTRIMAIEEYSQAPEINLPIIILGILLILSIIAMIISYCFVDKFTFLTKNVNKK